MHKLTQKLTGTPTTPPLTACVGCHVPVCIINNTRALSCSCERMAADRIRVCEIGATRSRIGSVPCVSGQWSILACLCAQRRG
jgi:hypothetical protein